MKEPNVRIEFVVFDEKKDIALVYWWLHNTNMGGLATHTKVKKFNPDDKGSENCTYLDAPCVIEDYIDTAEFNEAYMRGGVDSLVRLLKYTFEKRVEEKKEWDETG